MTTHRWIHGTPLVRHNTGERIEQGDLFEPTESELRAFGDRIEEVDEDVVGGQEGETYHMLDPSEYTIDELEAELGTGDYDEVLDEIRELEEDRQDRAGAKEAIKARIDYLNDE